MHKEEDPIECGLCECARVSLADRVLPAVECELCGLRYKTKASLYLHRSRKHRDQLRPYSDHSRGYNNPH